MRHTIVLIILISLSLNIKAQQNETKALSAKEIAFLGVDFSQFRLLDSFGFIDRNGKAKCAALRYKYYESWNEVFLIEQAKFNTEELLLVPKSKLTIQKSKELNTKINIDTCIIDNLEYQVSNETIQGVVNNYIGVVEQEISVIIVAESISKKLEEGKHLIVYFNSKTGKILLAKKYEASPVGYGFDNYWVNTIHKCLEQHRGYVKKQRKKLKIKF
jgi:hypothetical protein